MLNLESAAQEKGKETKKSISTDRIQPWAKVYAEREYKYIHQPKLEVLFQV